MDRVRRYFLHKVERGAVLSHKALEAYVKRNNIKLTARQHTRLARYRRRWHSMILFSRAHKVKEFASLAFPKPGIIHLDLGFFRKDLKGHNNKCIGIDSL
jgi:hypothetical protein